MISVVCVWVSSICKACRERMNSPGFLQSFNDSLKSAWPSGLKLCGCDDLFISGLNVFSEILPFFLSIKMASPFRLCVIQRPLNRGSRLASFRLISLLAALSKRVALLSVSNGSAIMPSAAAIDVSSAVIKGEMMDRSAS